MPWHLVQADGRWCVVKDSDGSTVGCHDSKADANLQLGALYAAESRLGAVGLGIQPGEYDEGTEAAHGLVAGIYDTADGAIVVYGPSFPRRPALDESDPAVAAELERLGRRLAELGA